MIDIKEGESLLMDVKEVQKVLGIGITNTYKIIKERNIPHLKFGRQIKVYRKGLYEFIEKSLTP